MGGGDASVQVRKEWNLSSNPETYIFANKKEKDLSSKLELRQVKDSLRPGLQAGGKEETSSTPRQAKAWQVAAAEEKARRQGDPYPALWATLYIRGKKVRALLDSGASVSLASADFCRRLLGPDSYKEARQRADAEDMPPVFIKGVGGKPLNPTKGIVVRMATDAVEGYSWEQPLQQFEEGLDASFSVDPTQ